MCVLEESYTFEARNVSVEMFYLQVSVSESVFAPSSLNNQCSMLMHTTDRS